MHFKKVLNHAPRKVAACLMVSALALGNTTPAIYATDMMSEEKMSEAETSIPSSEIGEDDKSQSQLENALIETDVTTKEIDTTNESSNTENNSEETDRIDESSTSLEDKNVETTNVGVQNVGDSKQVVEYTFGTGGVLNSEIAFATDTQKGFSDVTFPDVAPGWINNVYQERVAKKADTVSYITDRDGYIEVKSKVWTETESTGYGVYTYEETSPLSLKMDNKDYTVTVELYNPTDNSITAYVEAEDITKVDKIQIGAKESKVVTFNASLVDGVLDLKFLVSSSATTSDGATEQIVGVKSLQLDEIVKTQGEKPTIYIASDSTVQTYDASYAPQTGWGQTLYQFFGDFVEEREAENCNYSQSQVYETASVIIENRAIGGRSSQSFINEGKLDDLLEDIKPGDYLFLQWGHNDATAARPNRYVSPEEFDEAIQYYIDAATQRGAIPVLVTPVARYSYTTNADGSLNTFVGNFEAYGDVMRKLASEQDIPLIDLTKSSIEVCNSFGIEGAKSLFLMTQPGEYPNRPDGVNDSTHLQYYGAYKFSQCVAKGVLDNTNTKLDSLKQLVEVKIPDTVPETPTNAKEGLIGASSVSMTWDKVDGAELYYIYRAELSEGQTIDDIDFSNAEKYSVSVNPQFTDSKCESGKTYVYAVAAFNEKGLSGISNKISMTTKSAAYRYDFGISNSSNVLDGWLEVTENQMYDANVGYGWISAPGNGRNRAQDEFNSMEDDFCLGAGEFVVDLPNGDYELKIYAGDVLPNTSTIKSSFEAEEKAIGTISARRSVQSMTANVRVVDGQLNLKVGGTNPYINGLEITPIVYAPTGLNASEFSYGDINTTFLIGFNPIKEGDVVTYKLYQKEESDTGFTCIKEIPADKIDELDYRAMSVKTGQKYEFYVTGVLSDGTESAPSNTIEVNAIDESASKLDPPANVECVSAENGKIELSWDAVEGTISYNIYRSDKAEGEKGFKGYEKVGSSDTNTFIDTDSDLTTNIHYYYKIQVLGKGGLGELSKACQTPITGELIAAKAETLTDRAVVAVSLAGKDGGSTNVSAVDENGNEYTKGVYISWRSFKADPEGATYTVYRNGEAIAKDITVTNCVDPEGSANDIYKVVGSNDANLGLKQIDTKVWNEKYLELQLYKPADETMPDETTCSFSANDMSIGDVDGDGQYELIVKWYPSNAKDNSGAGYTGKTYIDAYDIDMSSGEVKLLWRIDLGVNIRSGAHYTQFQVWDFDGDGNAEIAMKTADGTTIYKSQDGTDQTLVEMGYVGACNSDALPVNTVSSQNDYRNSSGYILDGPEYFTMFDGKTATIIDTVDYLPGRGNVGAWGDGYGNRVDRFLSGVAYLNGTTPSAVFARGYYTRSTMTAYNLVDTNGDGIGDKIQVQWEFDTNNYLDQYKKDEIEAQGNHGLSINDVDNDGKDEIIYGSMVIDHDGTIKYTTGLGHGDAMHVSDWIPSNSGLEIMQVHEHSDAKYHVEIHDGETGEILVGFYTGKDTGRGVAADIDPTSPGAEFWSIANPNTVGDDEPSWDSKDGGVFASNTSLGVLNMLSPNSPAANASLFWDGDLLSEVQDHVFNTANGAYDPVGFNIVDWDYENNKEVTLLDSTEIWSNNGTKGNAGLIADILGDWREEVIARVAGDNGKIRVYTTTIETDYVIPTLMENQAYREGVAWQNVGYNQPANLSYLLSEGVITAQFGETLLTDAGVELYFTKASDGTYGHEVEGYEIYRKEQNGEFTRIDTVSLSQLEETMVALPDDGTSEVPEEPEELLEYKFDFGTKYSVDGWTNISFDAESVEENGTYGFTQDTITNNELTNKEYSASTNEDLKDIYNDCVLGTNQSEFVVNVPNGTYDVTIYAMNGSTAQYNRYSLNGELVQDVRIGNSGINTETKLQRQIVVEDGKISLTIESSKAGYKFVYLSGLEIKEVSDTSSVAAGLKANGIEGYKYVDKTAKEGTYYEYKVSAVVNGRSSYMSEITSVGEKVDIPDESEEATTEETTEETTAEETTAEETTAEETTEETTTEADNSSEEADNSSEEEDNSSEEVENSSEEVENSSEEVENSSEEAENSSEEVENSSEEVENSSEEVENSSEEVENSSEEADNSSEEASTEDSSNEQNSIHLKDNVTNIQISAAAGVLPEGAQLQVVREITEAQRELIDKLVKEIGGKATAYDISILKDGIIIQPNGEVTITIPISEDYNKNRLAVYHISDSGEKEELKFTIAGETVKFNAEHFSLYAIVEKPEGQSAETGDSTNLLSIAMVLVLSSGAMATIVLKRRKEEEK